MRFVEQGQRLVWSRPGCLGQPLGFRADVDHVFHSTGKWSYNSIYPEFRKSQWCGECLCLSLCALTPALSTFKADIVGLGHGGS